MRLYCCVESDAPPVESRGVRCFTGSLLVPNRAVFPGVGGTPIPVALEVAGLEAAGEPRASLGAPFDSDTAEGEAI